MTEIQYASLVISLSTLGQVAIEGLDQEQLRNLGYLLEAAAQNVAIAIAVQRRAPDQARLIEAMGPGPGKETTE